MDNGDAALDVRGAPMACCAEDRHGYELEPRCAEKTALGGGSFFTRFGRFSFTVTIWSCLCVPLCSCCWTLHTWVPDAPTATRPARSLCCRHGYGSPNRTGVLCEQCQSGFECSCTRCMLPTARKGQMKHRRVALSSLVVKLKTRRMKFWDPEHASCGFRKNSREDPLMPESQNQRGEGDLASVDTSAVIA